MSSANRPDAYAFPVDKSCAGRIAPSALGTRVMTERMIHSFSRETSSPVVSQLSALFCNDTVHKKTYDNVGETIGSLMDWIYLVLFL